MFCFVWCRFIDIDKTTFYYLFLDALMPHSFPISTTASLFFRTRTRSVNYPPSLSSSSSINMSSATTLDTIMKQKMSLRSKIKRDLKSMDPTLRSQEDEAIQKIVLGAPWFKSCKSLCAYISCTALKEVDTSIILSDILNNSSKDGKKLYVPRVEDKNCHMRMFSISRIDDLVANSMNILEPATTDGEGNEREDVMLNKYPVDLLLLPGLAFDRHGRRLGRGGGYYDTFLTKYQELAKEHKWKQPLLVALSYSLQIMEDGIIPVTQSDVSIDALVSSSGVIPISPAAQEWHSS